MANANQTNSSASYTKLRSGEWGIRIPGCNHAAGETITVHKKSGDQKAETIGRVVWSGNGVTLATISHIPRSPSQSRNDNAPHGRTCPKCGARDCEGAWPTNGYVFCDELD